ncbi:MAG TPA: hypothetical protein DD624_04740 [Alphaproteobacteria bacterium]|mgnify:FL=1|nr:hypothetical protein [Alphaproteobacteria bacterium]
MAVSSSAEDYLEALFQLESQGRKLTVTALAEQLNRTKGTVVTALKKLAEQGFVVHRSYGEIVLTDKGREIGWRIDTKHECLTGFFNGLLEIEKEKAEEIACLIEHHLEGGAAEKFFNLVAFLTAAQEKSESFAAELAAALRETPALPVPLTLFKGKKAVVCRGKYTGAIIENITAETCNINGRQVALSPEDFSTIWVKS